MTTSKWINLVAAVIALAGLVVAAIALWKQLAKLNDQLMLQHFAEYTKRYQEIISRFPEDINTAPLELNDRDVYSRTMRAMRAYIDLCFEEWFLNNLGLIDARVWALWRGGMGTAFSKQAFQEAWRIVIRDTRYGAEFEEFVNRLIAERPK